MKDYRLKITDQDLEKLRHLVLSDMPREAGAFALAGFSPLDEGGDIIVRRVIEIPRKMFFLQHEYRLEVSTQAINGFIALCETNGLGAVICHSHPEGLTYSPSDDHGEQRIVGTLRNFIPSNAPTASLLFSPNGVTGRVWVPGKRSPDPLTEILVIGRSIRRVRLNHSPKSAHVEHIYDRQVRAFGKQGQILINNARVGIVGIGGTGSPVAEQLVRLGVGDLVIIDPDVYDDTNVTRVYGTYPEPSIRCWLPFLRKQVSKAKLVAANLRKINPEAKIQVIPHNIVIADAAKKLLDRDVIFLCTDEHWGRSVVNQIVYQYFIPAINLGASITSKNGTISAAVGTIDMLRPDNTCLWCNQFLKSERIAAESTPKKMRQQLQREGYVQDIDTKAPSVISITTAVAGMGVSLFNQLLTDFMGDTGNISRLNYNVLDGTVRRGTTMVSKDCVCKHVRGFGSLKPTPTLKDLSFLDD